MTDLGQRRAGLDLMSLARPNQDSGHADLYPVAETRDFMRQTLMGCERKHKVGDKVCAYRGSFHGFEYWDTTVTEWHRSILDLLELPLAERKEWVRKQIGAGAGNTPVSSSKWLDEKLNEYEAQIMYMVLNLRPWKMEEEKGMFEALRRTCELS
jgi:hypothetical protein